jgi:hypothetical protein
MILVRRLYDARASPFAAIRASTCTAGLQRRQKSYREYCVHRYLVDIYLYIVVFLLVRGFPAYSTPVHVLYIMVFGFLEIQVAILVS